jgi:hypothetical protein
MTVRFDDVVHKVIGVLESTIPDWRPERLTLLRDIFGKVSVVDPGVPSNLKSSVEEALKNALQGYASDAPILLPANSGIAKAAIRRQALLCRVETTPQQKELTVCIADHKIVGQDWVAQPRPTSDKSPRIVFASLKGGVGRSTALCVTAAELAKRGFNVLVVDLDLEAPGLGSMLLADSQVPKYGVLDYLVENGRHQIDGTELDEFVATSVLTDRDAGQGIVDVVPATGGICLQNPHNVIAKLGRALVEDIRVNGTSISVRDQIASMVDRLVSRKRYDAVLIDARAGMAELTAGALFGLGATALLFGVDQRQTFEGYSYLLAHLAQLPPGSPLDDWRYNIRFVQAKASANPLERQAFKDALYELATDHFYEDADTSPNAFSFGIDEPRAPHSAWWVGFDGRFLGFDPVRDRKFLHETIYSASFGEFLNNVLVDLGLSDGE